MILPHIAFLYYLVHKIFKRCLKTEKFLMLTMVLVLGVSTASCTISDSFHLPDTPTVTSTINTTPVSRSVADADPTKVRSYTPTLSPPTSTPENLQIPSQGTVWGIFFDNHTQSAYAVDGSLDVLFSFHQWGNHIRFGSDGCYLHNVNPIYSFTAPSGFVIKETNLFGQTTSTRFAYTDSEFDPYRIHEIQVSPSGNWIVFKAAVGEIGMDVRWAEGQDVWLLRIDENQPQDLIGLTENGKAQPATLAWSPSGRFLAFGEQDKNEIVQISIFDTLDGKKIQISGFSTELLGQSILDFSWSRNEEFLAFSVGHYDSITPGAGVGYLSITDPEVDWLIYDQNLLADINNIYWSSDPNRLLLDVTETIGMERKLVWYALSSGSIEYTATRESWPELEWVGIIIPVDDITRLLMSETRIYLFDRQAGSITASTDMDIALMNWNDLIVPAGGPVDIAECIIKYNQR